jgi:predicted secreted protein
METKPFNMLIAAGCCAWSLAAQATDEPRSGVLHMNATAEVEVAKDLLSITFAAVQEGPDAAAVQRALKQALDSALQEARSIAKPGAVEVRTGNFSLYPRITPKGQPSGWQGRAELVVEGRDIAAIGQLSGRIASMSIAHVAQGLSREVREKAEAEAAAQAIARFRQKAASTTQHFGYASYSLREVNLSGSGPAPFQAPMLRAEAVPGMANAPRPLQVEAGMAVVMVNVSGSVQMTK